MDKLPTIENWINLPTRVGEKEVVSIFLTDEEAQSISEYGDKMFDKATIDAMPSQWASSKGLNKPNPNTTGIRGEYAGYKHFRPDEEDLVGFLSDRPWRMSDMGDAVLIGKTARVFDYKTRTRNLEIPELIKDDTYMAEMDIKFSLPKYGYLQAFIFCVNNSQKNTIHLMGWLTTEEMALRAQIIPKGSPIPNSRFPYGSDTLCVPYRRLRPMKELSVLNYHAITQNMTIKMREDWNRGITKWDAKQYLQSL